MDPHSFIARAEAQRWLGIAEKLLMSQDLVGSKTFAIRARDSDPRLEAANQILAIADTLLAAEKPVGGNNGAQLPDYYAILQLVRFVQDTDHIADQYRRLAVVLNPHHNRYPYSDQAFQLVNDAWAVLSNPMRKSMYDSELDFAPQQQMNSLGFNLEHQHHHQQQHHQQQQHNFFSINQELPESPQTFQTRLQQSHQHQQLQQHNFLSQPNPSVREPDHLFQHREQEQMFQSQVQPFQVTSPPHQQTRPSPQPRTPIHSPPSAASQPPFSWRQEHLHQQLQQKQIKQEQQQNHIIKQEHQLQQQQQQQQQLRDEQLNQQKMQEEQLKQQKLHQEQLKQQQIQQEQLKQQRLQEEQLKQQRLQEERLKQQRMHEEQLKQQRMQEEQLKQQRMHEEQLKQQQMQEEQLKQQQLQQERLNQQQMQQEQLKQQQLKQEQLKQQQLQQEQLKQQHLLQEQHKQQHMQQEQQKQQESLKQNAAAVQHPSQVNSNNGVREEETETEIEAEAETQTADENVDDSPTFWTSCPYCFYMYEYPRLYADCTLRCENCKRAFQAVRISSPPPIVEGQDAYFCCWGFIPVGVSMSHLQKDNTKGTNSNWTPFSPLFDASKNVHSHLNECAAPKENTFVNKSSGPLNYFGDITDDVFVGVSESRNSSDIKRDSPKKNNLTRMNKGLESGFKERIQVLALMALNVRNGSVKNLKHGIPVQESAGVIAVPVEEISKKVVGDNLRRQSGRVAKELGKLDLNVEFNNNEGDEPSQRISTGTHGNGHGEEDNIEGIGFFEGLDEFLSSLPILSVVNEGKVMAT